MIRTTPPPSELSSIPPEQSRIYDIVGSWTVPSPIGVVMILASGIGHRTSDMGWDVYSCVGLAGTDSIGGKMRGISCAVILTGIAITTVIPARRQRQA